jgi:Icc-related predicted phosphoesterase
MWLLMSADLHGKWPVINWLLGVARERHVDAIVLAGDLLGCPDGFDSPEEAQRHDASMLNELLDGAGIPVFYVMGNDDLVELNSSSDRVRSVHGRQVRWRRFTFVGYQYSLPFMGGTFEKSEVDIEADLASLAALFDAETIFVSHSPILGVLDPGFGEAQIGSRSLQQFLEAKPYLAHIHGHSHAGFGRTGKHFNVASAGRRRAMLLDVETMQHHVLNMEPQEIEA